MAPRLKVFVTSDGLTDYVVATTSKAKALSAWGLKQDAFKEGRAQETSDPELVRAATAKPGEVLRRPAGTRGELEALKVARRPAPSRPTPAQRKRVADLEAQLAGLQARLEGALASLAEEAATLERRRSALEAKAEAERSQLEGRLAAARAALG